MIKILDLEKANHFDTGVLCIGSAFHEIQRTNFELIVLDNTSSDDLVKKIQAEF